MFELIKIEFPLKYTWKISRSSTNLKINYIVRFTMDNKSYYGEVAPNLRYGETEDRILNDFDKFNNLYNQTKRLSVEDLINIKDQLDLCHCLQFGIESAFIHYHAAAQNKTVYEYFGLKKAKQIYTSYSLPIMDLNKIEEFIKPLDQYKYLKIKVNDENAYETLKEVTRVTDKHLFVDGNEAWTDVEDLIRFLEKVKGMPISFLEQAMPSRMVEEYKYLKKNTDTLLIADESIENQANFDELSQQFHGINIKLMKTGGYINALNLINGARNKNMKIMIGCMVESSLGISSALNLCHLADFVDLDGFLIIKDEPFELVKIVDGELRYNKVEISL